MINFRLSANLPIGIEEEHAKEHGNKASHNVVPCQLDGQHEKWDAGGETVFAFDKSFKAPDEEADSTDERIDPFKLWPKVVGKQHPCQDSTKTLMVEFMEEVPAIQIQRVSSHLRLQ